MEFNIIIALVIVILIVIAFAVAIVYISHDYKKNPQRYTVTCESEEAKLKDTGNIITAHAEVIDMVCSVSTVGYQAYKQPRAEKYFIIKFRYDNGDIADITVTEELYDGFEIGLVGTLILIDGQISSFEPDET